MRYYLNTQHPAGKLISLALVREDGRSLYIVLPHDAHSEAPGVQEVLAVLKNTPESPVWPRDEGVAAAGVLEFLTGNPLVVGSPENLRVFGLFMGEAAEHLSIVHVCDTYTEPRVPRNAWWEAVALAEKLGAELGG